MNTWEEENKIRRNQYDADMAAKSIFECRKRTCKDIGFKWIMGELLCFKHYNQDCDSMSKDG